MTSSLGKIKASDKPQHHFLLECRREGIITRKDTTKLLEAFRETGLSNLQRIIEDYNQISNCPDVRVTVNNDNPTSAFSNFKTFMLSKKRAIKSVFTWDKGIHFVDCQEGSLVICLKVSSVEELDKLKEYIESGELLRRLMARYESEISDTERKDFQSESSSIKLCYDTEEFDDAKQQLTTNNASFRQPFAFSQSLTSEETQNRIETSTSQDGMEEYFDALCVVPTLSEKDDGDSEEDFLKYLDKVGLKEYFPRKLTMKKATEVRLFPSDDSQIETKDLPFLFISKLTSLDSRITWKENLHIEGSARDFIYAILHCSDDHLRQHLLEKFASCQLAVPVLLPGMKESTFTLLWISRAQWYLPICGRKEELLKEVTLLLNLRGDSKEFTTESEFMCRIANAVFLFVDNKLGDYKTAISELKERFKNVFVIRLIGKQGRKVREKSRPKHQVNIKDTNPKSVNLMIESISNLIVVKLN
ncbi:putative interferon-induced very large GTPase 1-like [Apostichopus japonicus]|uniref:Putative interferon-induced very large GTPase 1-like n=1 Tax=Stichopus japonicus TaxID=307972 RepID=A0A2G8L695_STIJA|nr:putative interferon-induced very large GTPase 1-like [Apostichopus japonicus]